MNVMLQKTQEYERFASRSAILKKRDTKAVWYAISPTVTVILRFGWMLLASLAKIAAAERSSCWNRHTHNIGGVSGREFVTPTTALDRNETVWKWISVIQNLNKITLWFDSPPPPYYVIGVTKPHPKTPKYMCIHTYFIVPFLTTLALQ